MKLVEMLRPLLENKQEWIKQNLGGKIYDILRFDSSIWNIIPARFNNQLSDVIHTEKSDSGFEAIREKSTPILDHIIETFKEEADPTPNNKYLQWIAKMYANGDFRIGEDLSTVRNALDLFHKNKKALDKKDINQYETLGRLYAATEQFVDSTVDDERERNLINSGDAEVIYDQGGEKVIIPRTYKASEYYGKDKWNTSWCTNGSNMYASYTRQGPLYIIETDVGPNPPYQIHFESQQFMDKYDARVAPDELMQKSAAVEYVINIALAETEEHIRSGDLLQDDLDGPSDGFIVSRVTTLYKFNVVDNEWIMKNVHQIIDRAVGLNSSYDVRYILNLALRLLTRKHAGSESLHSNEVRGAYYEMITILEDRDDVEFISRLDFYARKAVVNKISLPDKVIDIIIAKTDLHKEFVPSFFKSWFNQGIILPHQAIRLITITTDKESKINLEQASECLTVIVSSPDNIENKYKGEMVSMIQDFVRSHPVSSWSVVNLAVHTEVLDVSVAKRILMYMVENETDYKAPKWAWVMYEKIPDDVGEDWIVDLMKKAINNRNMRISALKTLKTRVLTDRLSEEEYEQITGIEFEDQRPR